MSQRIMAMAVALTEVIKVLKEVPSGHLYAGVMSHMSLSEFEGIVFSLVKAKLITYSNGHLITWIGGDQ